MIVIHIGLPKCGSSTIQTFLDGAASTLATLGVDYPEIGREKRKAHHAIANELRGRDDLLKPGRAELGRLATHFATSAASAVVLSSESFAGCPKAGVERLGEAARAAGRPVRVFLVIRDLIEQAPSAYAQQIRYGHHGFDFDEFFRQRWERSRFDVFAMASRWAAVFGWDALWVRTLEGPGLEHDDLIADLMTVVGLDPIGAPFRALPLPARMNQRAGWRTLEAGRGLFHRQGALVPGHPLARLVTSGLPAHRMKRLGTIAESVGESMGWNADRGRYLTAAQAVALHQANGLAVDQLNGRLPRALPPPADLAARGFEPRAFLPEVSRIPPAELRDFHDALAARVVGGPEAERIDPRPERRARKAAEKTAARIAGKEAARGGAG